MKINDLRHKEVKLSDLSVSDHVGFVDSMGQKGYLVFIGSYVNESDRTAFPLSTISAVGNDSICNTSFGNREQNQHESVEDALNFKKKCCVGQPEEVFVFSTRKELYRWLAED